jgi:hypothetical protein
MGERKSEGHAITPQNIPKKKCINLSKLRTGINVLERRENYIRERIQGILYNGKREPKINLNGNIVKVSGS